MGLYHGNSSLYAGRRGLYAGPKRQAGGFSPLQLPGLDAWIDPADETAVTHSAGEASLIEDKSPNGFDCTTAAADPVYPASIGGMKACDFQGVDRMQMPSIATTHSGYFALIAQPASLQNSSVCGNQRFAAGIRLMFRSNGEIWVFREDNGATNDFFNFGVAYAANQIIIVFVQWELNTELLVNVNGFEKTSAGRTKDPTQASTRWGYGQTRPEIGSVEAFDGKLGEHIIGKDVTLDGAQREALVSYLTTKWTL